MTARGWTSLKEHGHGGEVTDMQWSAYSARGAAGVPSGTASHDAEIPERAWDAQV